MPPVWPSPRPDIIGTTAPQAAASGARMSDVLSPTPPVLCLSTAIPATSGSDAHAGPDHGVGQRGRLLGRHAADADGHEQRGGLVVGQRAVGYGRDEGLDVGAIERAAVPLVADQIDGTHAEWCGTSRTISG